MKYSLMFNQHLANRYKLVEFEVIPKKSQIEINESMSRIEGGFEENKMEKAETVFLEDDMDEMVSVNDVKMNKLQEYSRVETLDEMSGMKAIFNNGNDEIFFSEFKKGLKLHIDFQFPPNFKSVVGKCQAFNSIEKEIEFLRVSQIFKPPLVYKLEDGDHSLKLFQVYPNYFGNFMFCLALMMIHKKRETLMRVLNNQDITKTGIYTFNLYINHKWKTVEVDDYLPVFKKILLFCTSSTDELWPTFLEKAYSKCIGSYFEASRIFDLEMIILTLTGFPSKKFFLEEKERKGRMEDHFNFIDLNLKQGNIVVLKTKGIFNPSDNIELKSNH